ncbi:F-box protein VBF-like [Andrographis paniculata]|uniref:F-box protein VBF-like n=1 Tax=Andrographis paniculata TaxID=175694 RepID=UPI0021E7E4AD|nr:F-box protein VBF-like [Andrographis paniculata]
MEFRLNNIADLPEDCVARILSLTSPVDACRVLAVSKGFRSPAESDAVWRSFLPEDYHQIVASNSLKFSSRKELFFLLSNSILINGGRTVFGLHRSSGRKFFVLSARSLSNFHNVEWTWKSNPDSRFSEVAELISTDRLEIHGRISSKSLSPNTNYAAYLIFKLSENPFGLDSIPCETQITSSSSNRHRMLAANTARLRDPTGKNMLPQRVFYQNRMDMMKRLVNDGREMEPQCRGGGWLQLELGEFAVAANNHGGGAEEIIEIDIMEVKGHQLKGGLIVEGIEVRPKS